MKMDVNGNVHDIVFVGLLKTRQKKKRHYDPKHPVVYSMTFDFHANSILGGYGETCLERIVTYLLKNGFEDKPQQESEAK
jgi:hypothetical protein